MIILVDTREQRNMHVTTFLADMGIKFKSKHLDFGDYSFELNGKSYENKVVIERKASFLEIAGNFCNGRGRFEAEFRRAMTAGCQMHLVIEEANGWKKLNRRMMEDIMEKRGIHYRKRDTWKSQFCANSMICSLASWQQKYDLRIEFLKKENFVNYMISVFDKYLEGEKNDSM